jgi:hypothetical protein
MCDFLSNIKAYFDNGYHIPYQYRFLDFSESLTTKNLIRFSDEEIREIIESVIERIHDNSRERKIYTENKQ